MNPYFVSFQLSRKKQFCWRSSWEKGRVGERWQKGRRGRGSKNPNFWWSHLWTLPYLTTLEYLQLSLLLRLKSLGLARMGLFDQGHHNWRLCVSLNHSLILSWLRTQPNCVLITDKVISHWRPCVVISYKVKRGNIKKSPLNITERVESIQKKLNLIHSLGNQKRKTIKITVKLPTTPTLQLWLHQCQLSKKLSGTSKRISLKYTRV